MNISEIFIRRPVMTTLVMAAFLLTGLFGYMTLPVSELPSIDYPTISVIAKLPGASPETMARSVATPLEKQFSTVPGIDSMNSTSSQGTTNITITFKLDRSIDAAAQDIELALNATGGLPRDMPNPPVVRKQNPSDAPILLMKLISPVMQVSEIDAYAENLMVPRIATLEGVASVDLQGQSKRAIRIQIDPDALAARGIGIDQVTNAVKAASVNQATGQLDGPQLATVIQTQGQLLDAEHYKNQTVSYANGGQVRLADVGRVVDSIENIRSYNTYNGQPAIGLNILRQPGSNTVAVVDAVMKQLDGIKAQLPPALNLEVTFDRSQSIRNAIHDVQWTMVGSALLVVGVIFLFLRSVSATLIPSVAMPIAIIGTFGGMAFMGYSLDNLSLMALTLSVIFIVDDAIVMLENITRHVESGQTPYEASLTGSREVSSTILTMTLSLAAVFIPVLFMGGILGRLLHEFAVTIVIAILISGVVSVTLTPMLCSKVIKADGEHDAAMGGFHRRSEAVFDWFHKGYETSLKWSLAHRRFILGLFFTSLAATAFLFEIMPQDFLPAEDVSQINIVTLTANGTSFADTVRRQKEAEAIIRVDPDVKGIMSSVFGGRQGGITVRLKDRGERIRKMSIDQEMAQLRRKLAGIPGMTVFLQNPPSIKLGGVATRAAYQYVLQSADKNELYAASQRLVDVLAATPGFNDVNSNLDLTTPALNVDIDREAAAKYGVSVQAVEDALGLAFAGSQISTIYTDADQYQVVIELLPEYQRDPTALSRLYITGSNGALVPFSSVTKTAPGSISLSENHLGQLPAVTLSFGLDPGVPLSFAVNAMDGAKLKANIPTSVVGSFQGTAQAFQQSMQGMGYLLIAGVLVVYIMLGILYESFIHPLTILSGLPAAAVGALMTLYVLDIPLTLYAFVGMIMLIGIVKKNAIMMIDFALDRQRNYGIDPETAIFEAALVRFRPIMMTTMAALVGAVPIAIGLGAGGEGRRPLGVAVVGGLLLSQSLTLYITPVIYGYLDRLGVRLSRPKPVPMAAE